jgi:hypothetical protein
MTSLLPIADCRGQSYDNASNMSGKYNGMQAIIRQQCNLAEYVQNYYMISTYVCLYIEQNIRHKSESLYERILYFNNNIDCALKGFKRNMSH